MNHIPEYKKKYFPITHAQKRIYYDEKIFPGTSWANNSWLVKYKKILDFNLLSQAINQVVKKNDGLRLRILELDIENEPQQYISPYEEIPVDYVDFNGPNSERRFQEWLDGIKRKSYHLLDSDLFHFVYVIFNEKESGYFLNIHHIVADGWTCFLLFKDIDEIYEALESGKPITNTLKPSYSKYITDELEYLQSQQLKKDQEFWHQTFLPLPKPANLSFKSGNPNNIEANNLKIGFPNELRLMIHKYREKNKTSIFKIILSTLSILISRFTGLNDVCIGSVNHGRTKDNYKDIAGMFVSTLSYRIQIDGNMAYNVFLEKVGESVNYILKNHQQYPFDRLVTELKEKSGIDTSYLRNISLIGHGDVKSDEFNYEYIFPGYEPADLLVHINISNKDKEGILELEWIFQVEKFYEFEIRGFHQGLVNILKDVVINPEKKISEINFLSPEEKVQVLYKFNNTKVEFLENKVIHQLFEAEVERTPSSCALKNGDEQLTYRQLNNKANQLAAILNLIILLV
jgi:hypothetical protein